MHSKRANWYDHAELYEIAFGWDTAPEIAFLEQLFAKHSAQPVRTIYEPFSGSGRLSLPLARRGYRVTGVELNPHMLKRAVQHAAILQAPVGYQQADVTAWRCHPPVDAIVTLIDSFRHLAEADAAATALRSFRASVRTGGLLIIGLSLGDAPDAQPWTTERGGLKVTASVSDTHRPGPFADTTLVRCRLEATGPSTPPQAVECEQPLRRWRLESLRATLKSTGFELLETWSWRKTPQLASDPDPSDSVVTVSRTVGL